MTTLILIHVLIGLSVLFYGRRLFWLFVGAVGFMLAMTLARPLLIGQPEWAVVTVGLGLGIVGALCALALERVAVAIAGFVAGGAIAVRVVHMAYPHMTHLRVTNFHVTNLDGDPLVWLIVLVGAILGVLVVRLLFDWALIVLSSAVGASLVADCLRTRPDHAAILFIVLLIVGIAIQSAQLRQRNRVRI